MLYRYYVNKILAAIKKTNMKLFNVRGADDPVVVCSAADSSVVSSTDTNVVSLDVSSLGDNVDPSVG